jgi:hypothetical protein
VDRLPGIGPSLRSNAVLLAAGVVATAAFLFLPELASDRGDAVPPAWLFAAAGIIVAFISAVGIWLIAQGSGLPDKAVSATVTSLACIAIVKFTFAPLGLYEANRTVAIDTPAGPTVMLLIVAGGVLLLYLGVLRLIYVVVRSRLPETLPAKGASIGLVLSVLASGGVFVLGSLFALNQLPRYLELVFTSLTGVAVAVTLVAAASLMALAFSSAKDRADAAGRASILASVLWVATAFIILFHVLWVVFLLSLIAVWRCGR